MCRSPENAGQRHHRGVPKQLGEPSCLGYQERQLYTLLRGLPQGERHHGERRLSVAADRRHSRCTKGVPILQHTRLVLRLLASQDGPKDIDKTTFVSRQGLFRFTMMPFGLCNAPARFEWLMELILTGLNWKIYLIYLDDVIVYGGNFYEALDRLKQVWQHIRKAHLKLKPSKCCLMHDRASFLWHYVSREGVEVDPMKTAVVQDWPTPHTVKGVRAFLGLASYYRRYIPNFAAVAAPLTGLTKKDAKMVWGDDCEQAFLALKKAPVQPPMLAYPTRDGQFVLSTDASDMGMSAVLEQEQEEGGQVVKRIIAYASKTLNASQRRYCTTNKELLAVMTAVELFKYYYLLLLLL